MNTLTREPGALAFTAYTPYATTGVVSGANGSQSITLTAAEITALVAAGAGVGSGVTGTNVGTNAIITNIDTVTVPRFGILTLSVANTAAVTTALTLQVNQVTVAPATAAQLTNGMVVTGTGIPAGTTITVVGNVVTFSQPATATVTGNQTYQTASSVGISSNANANLVIGSAATAGTLNYIGTGNTTDRGFTILGAALAGGATINANGVGATSAIVFDNVGRTITNAGNNTLTLGGANTLNNTMNEIIAGTGAGGGSGIAAGISVRKQDAGRWVLSAPNTYSGSTAVNVGTLSISNNTGLGTATGVAATGTVVANGATLGLQNGITVGNEKLDINGPGASVVIGALRNESGTNTFGGLVTAVTNSTIAAAPTTTLNLTGGVVKDAVVLTIRGGGTVNINTTGISGATAGTSDLVVADAGTIVNLNVANTYNGPTFIQDGATVNANVASALPTVARTAVTMDATGAGGSTLAMTASQQAASLTSPVASSIVNLNANTLTVGAASGTTTFAGAIGGAGGNLIKDSASTQVLSGSNGYTGTTTVSGGTLTVSGSLSGTSAVTVNTGGTLLLNSAANNIVNTAATATLAGGTLAFGNAANQIQNLGVLTLSVNSILDFGTSGGADKFAFGSLPSHTAGTTLTINNWFGNVSGGVDGTDDRLVFSGVDTDFTGVFNQADVSFGGFGSGYAAISFAGGYEIVPVPEPATTALIGSVALCALIGYRERRRFTGIRSRLSRK